MFSVYRKLYDLLDNRERYLTLLVFAVMVLVAIVETAGVASIMPFIAVLSNPEIVQTNVYLSEAYELLGVTSINSFFFFMGLGVFVLLILSLVLKALSTWMQFRFAYIRNHSIGVHLIEEYLNRPYYWYLDHNTSDLATKVLAEVSHVVHGALFPAMQIIAQGLVALFIIILLIAVDPALSLIVAAVLFSAYFSVYYFNHNVISRLGESTRLSNLGRFHVVHEAFGGIKDVKIAGIESNYIERFRIPSLLFAKSNLRHKTLSELPSFVMQGLVYGGMLLILLYLIATKGGLEDALPVIMVFAFGAYRLMPSLQSIYQHVSELRFNTPSLEALHADLLGIEAESGIKTANSDDNRKQPIEVLSPKESVLLDGITYSYPYSNKHVLTDINIRIPVNSTVGLVGATGSGKTTLVDIMLGLLIPSNGHIYSDNIKITSDNIRSWQKILGYVPQQIYLTDDSVVANIAFGVPKDQVEIRDVETAAKLANLHDFIVSELPNGYEAEVGERGVRLSGGQRQRIGIARALYHDPDILILDEATSALDNITEKAVMDAVNNLGNRKTIIMIAHRISTVKNCDCIYLMEGGKVIAAGDYKKLMNENRKFREMAGHEHVQ